MKTLLVRLWPSVALGLVVAMLVGCATAPITGRRQLALVPEAQVAQLGMTSFEQIKQEMPINRDPEINALVQRVGERIAAVASPDMPDAQWEFVVFEHKEPNAFCLPGGKIGIHTGILPITKDEAGLATVMGHEVAHAAAGHGGERLSEAMAMQLGGSLLGAAFSGVDPQTIEAMRVLYGLGAQLGRVLPHSRAQELEADHIGLIYMARAGYNPEAAVGFWERFAEYSQQRGTSVPGFLRTHPVDRDRIRQIQRLLPEARVEFQKSRAVDPLIRQE